MSKTKLYRIVSVLRPNYFSKAVGCRSETDYYMWSNFKFMIEMGTSRPVFRKYAVKEMGPIIFF